MKNVTIFVQKDAHKRVKFGISLLEETLKDAGYTAGISALPENFEDYRDTCGYKLYIGVCGDEFTAWLRERDLLLFHADEPTGEGFGIETCAAYLTAVCGGSPTGALYGCLTLAEKIRKNGEFPREIAVSDKPEFLLRGPAIGLQKTKIEPPRLTYEYPITPARFPWFYDRAHWLAFLTKLLNDRCNVLYIWSGHPFSSLVKVPDYPFALEVTEDEFQLNKEVFAWLTEECDKRGIWVVLKFYNIHIPLPFAQHYGLPQLQSSITPLVADYTFKSIVEFIKSYPNLGLMVCLGEALRGNAQKTLWFVETIVPAVLEGLAQAGIAEQPPLILRGHDCDPVDVMAKALPLYANLFTMWKYNGEGLTTCRPRGSWQKKHLELSKLGRAHIINVHILADLEPFRFSAPLYIQKCVRASRSRLGGNALHLYPLFYWDWPFTPDKTEPRLLQHERDTVWFEAWHRYAWQPDRNEEDERLYWTHRFAEIYGVAEKSASSLLEALECAGQCAPRLLGRIGITEGNRQTLSLGMSMSQLTNVMRYRPNAELWNSVANQGEQAEPYVKKELARQKHVGETPVEMIQEVMYFASRAKDFCAKALETCEAVSKELGRIKTDIDAIYLLSLSLCKKLEAALLILEYRFTMSKDCLGDTTLLERAIAPWQESIEAFRRLSELGDSSYLYFCSMLTPQRKIPFSDGSKYGLPSDCLPEYEKEFDCFKKNTEKLKAGIVPESGVSVESVEAFVQVPFDVVEGECEAYTLEAGQRIFTDCHYQIKDIAPELQGLSGLRVGLGKAIGGAAELTLDFKQNSRLLIGYINARGLEWLQPPELETNTHADEQGGLEAVLKNAIRNSGCPGVNIHALRFQKGVHRISLGNGGFIVAGVIEDREIAVRDAGLAGEGYDTLDWMYEG